MGYPWHEHGKVMTLFARPLICLGARGILAATHGSREADTYTSDLHSASTAQFGIPENANNDGSF